MDENKKSILGRVASRFYYGSVHEHHFLDHLHQWALRIIAFLIVVLLVVIVTFLTKLSWPAIEKYGASFLFKNEWNPFTEEFGGLAFIFGTLSTSLLAVAIAAPLSVGIALFSTQICPSRLRYPVTFFIELLAAIPSIVYGLWALFFLCPFIRETIAPWVQEDLGLVDFFLFEGPAFGIGTLAATLVLSIMIIPTITAVSTEVYKSIPKDLSYAALALGATRWEAIKMAVFAPGLKGIFGAIILGLGRAFGETMAVAMVIGNKSEISFSLFSPSATMASVMANEYAEATSAMHTSSLAFIGLTLFAVSFVVNPMARFTLWKFGPKKGSHA